MLKFVDGSKGKRNLRKLVSRIVLYTITVSLAGIFLLPFLWLISTAVKPMSQIFLMPPRWIPNPIEWDNFLKGWTAFPFTLYLGNTLIITLTAMTGQLLTASMAAYSFSLLKWPGRDLWFILILATLMMPYVVLLIPMFILFRYLDWIDTFKPLIVPSWFGGGAFSIFLLRQFCLTIPSALLDAAKIDGCPHWKIWLNIMMPLCKPALITVGIFSFMAHWNDFMGPLIYLNSQNKRTLTLALEAFKRQYTTQWNLLMATSTIVIVPIIVIFFFAQRHFIRGITMSGIKG